MPEPERVVYEFGPFQLDATKRLLYRDGQLLHASPKCLETLVILVRNHGQLLEKDELIRLIWPDTFVEESNLAIQISQLRKLLTEPMGLDPISTIPRRGYRFAAGVQRVAAIRDASAPAVEQAPGAEPLGPAAPDSPPPAELRTSMASEPLAGRAAARRRSRLLALGAALAAMLLLVVAVVGVRWRALKPIASPAQPAAPAAASAPPASPPPAVLTEKDRVLLADVQNDTGESVFDRTLRQALSIQLEQSPFLALISDQEIQHTLRMMNRVKGAPLTPELSWEVCQRTGGAAVIYGSVANLADQYILGLRAVNCRTGDSLANQQVTVTGKDHVLNAVDQAATQLRRRLGESLAQIQKYNTPIEQATTPSLAALKAYSVGWLLNYARGDSAGAISFFKRAVQLDAHFAMAYAALGQSYSNMSEPGLAAQNLKRAYALRAGVSERERFYIEARYENYVTGDLEKARLINQQWTEVYPRDALPHTSLGYIDRYLGQYERGLAEAREALRLEPNSAQNYANLLLSQLLLNHLGEAKALSVEAQAKQLDSPLLQFDLNFVAYLQKDRETSARLEAWSVGREGVEDGFLEDKSSQFAYVGQRARALEFSQRAITSALHAGSKEAAAGYETHWALIEALFGDSAEARQYAAAALRLSEDRDTKYGAALAFALAGEPGKAGKLAGALDQAFPADTAVQRCYLPAIRAAMALRAGDGAAAIQLLEDARPYELGLVTALYPVYLRGEAYLAQGQPAAAAVEFQKIIDTPGVVVDDPIGALAHLQLGRSYALQEPARARAEYQTFFELWRDAAEAIPVLAAARAEYAQLKAP